MHGLMKYHLGGTTYMFAISDFLIDATGRVHTEEWDSNIHNVNGLGQNTEWHVNWHVVDGLSGAFGNSHLYRVSQNKLHSHSWHLILGVFIKCVFLTLVKELCTTVTL